MNVPRLGLGHGDQFLHGIYAERRLHNQHIERLPDGGDGSEILDRIKRQLGIECRVGGERGAGEEQCVAIRRGTCHQFAAQ